MAFHFEKLSVLVVEDTPPMRKLICSVLKTLGVGHIYNANNGEKGFDLFQQQIPDIVITDWHMEPMSGIDLVKEIRSNPYSRNRMTPVILLTGYNAMTRVYTARDIGVTEYLAKPFTAEDLAKRIAHIITKPRDFIDNRPEFFGPDRRRRKSADYGGPYRRKADAV